MLPRLQYVCKLMQFSASFLLADVNECWRYPGRLCAQTCDNTPGSYQCSCTTGFSLAFDGKNCEGTSICTSRIEHRSVLPANNVLCSDSMNVLSFQLKWDTNRVKNKNRWVSCQLKYFLGDWSALFLLVPSWPDPFIYSVRFKDLVAEELFMRWLLVWF